MNKPTLIERFADNGAHSHWELVTEDGLIIWSEQIPPFILLGAIVFQNKKLREMCKDIESMFPLVSEYMTLTNKVVGEILVKGDSYDNYEDLQKLKDLNEKFTELSKQIKA